MRPLLNNVLIVDDNKNDLEIAQYYLNKKFDGLMFMVAESGKDFDEKMTWLKPDLIISDFNLPDCTGLDLLIKVRADADIPFIFMSGTLQDHDDKLSQSILNGANGYVLKDKIKNLPDIVDKVMESEYIKRKEAQKREDNTNKLKLKLQKSIQMIINGADQSLIIDNLKDVHEKLK
jgi:CheY-like chemotaxis protein